MIALESRVYILPRATGKHLHMDRIERTDNSDVPISGTIFQKKKDFGHTKGPPRGSRIGAHYWTMEESTSVCE
jgi:hypothetical protein